VPFNSGNLKHLLDCRFEKYQLCDKKYRGRGRTTLIENAD